MTLGPPVVTQGQIWAEVGSVFDIVQLREFRFDQVEPGFTLHLRSSGLTP
jgi:hypothetical protein